MPRKIIKVVLTYTNLNATSKRSLNPLSISILYYVDSTQIIKIVLYRTCLIIKMSFRSISTFYFGLKAFEYWHINFCFPTDYLLIA